MSAAFRRALLVALLLDPTTASEDAENCPWLSQNTEADNVLGCADGTTCNAMLEGWECCSSRGGRELCPPNLPNMCAPENACAGGSDYCCEEVCPAEEGGIRSCTSPDGQVLHGADFSDLECSGDITRSWHVEDYPTSATTAEESGCIGPLEAAWFEGEWSIMGEYCDFSSEPPMLRGTWYGSGDCSTEPQQYAHVADGSCVTHDSHSSKFNCVLQSDVPPPPPPHPQPACLPSQ